MERVLNVEKHKFLSIKGVITPKYIWKGTDSFNNELKEVTKTGLVNSINRNNRLFTKHPNLNQ